MHKFITVVGICSALLQATLTPTVSAQTLITYVRNAEAAMILLKYSGAEIDFDVQTYGTYPDIVDGEWYVPYVIAGLDAGILELQNGLVQPHRSVSRAEFLEMMTKTYGLTTNLPYEYTDVNAGASYAPYVGLSWRYTLFDTEENPQLLQPDLRITHREATKAIYTLLRAEPSLQPKKGMFPVKYSEHIATKSSAPKPSVLDTTVQSVSSVLDLMTPNNVKNAVISLLQSRGHVSDQTRTELVGAVNAVRAEYNLAPLTMNTDLQLSAQRHAEDMADRGYFSHYTPEGLSYIDRIRAGGYLDVTAESCSCAQQFNLGDTIESGPGFSVTGNEQCSCEPVYALGENLAKGQLSVDEVLEDWMNSEGHRKNILRPQFTEIGIGLFENIWVQNFGKVTFE